MENSKLFANQLKNPTSNLVLHRAFTLIQENDQVQAGSSTACIISLTEHNTLEYSNLGDSGFLIYRPSNGIIFRTTEQQHFFNAPFQLMYVTPSLRRKLQTAGHLADLPEHSNQGQIYIQENDIVVLGTDGLFDNLFDDEIVEIIKKHPNVHEMSKELLKETLERSHSTFRLTPFMMNAMKHGAYFPGGKVDDITIIIGKVSCE